MPFDCDALLADGSVVTIRPAAAADRDALRALHEGLSPESLYLRFFSVSRQAALEYVDRLLLPQTSDHATLVGVAGDRMLAVGNFERLDGSPEAEIALVVADPEHGRGAGTLLIEDLAVLAREGGIRRFRAEILAENATMLHVLADTGFPVAKRYDDGVVDVIVTLDADETVLTAVDKRDQHATVRSLERVLRPRSVALIGASRKPHAVGHEVLRNLLASGFSGPIYPVNSRADRVLGVATYRSVEDIRDPIDLAVIAVPAAQAEEAVAQCGRRQVHGVVVLSAGFADTGAAGAASQQALLRLARRYGMRLIGPNCIGVVNTEPAVRLNATFAPTPPRPGPIGFLSQSGGLGIALLERATALEVGVSTFVSVGNQADVSTNDLLWWWEQDPATGVIALYVESFGNPRKFARIARRVSHSKPIVAIKGGRSAVGARAARSHSAAAATPSAEVAALFQQAGVVAVDTLGELFGVATVLTHTRLPAGRRLAILGNAGGPNVLAADAAAGTDLELARLSPATTDRLRQLLAPGACVDNPVDTIASVRGDAFATGLQVIAADDGVDTVLALITPTPLTGPHELADAMDAVAAELPVPLVLVILGQGPAVTVRTGGAAAIPCFATPEDAVGAVASVAGYAAWRRRPTGTPPELPDIDTAAARRLVADAVATAPDGRWLTPPAAAELVRSYRIPVCPIEAVRSCEDALAAARRLGWPVALKAADPQLVHKSDVGGVALNLSNDAALRTAWTAMASRLPLDPHGATVSPMASPGVETIVGIASDPLFGPLVLFGLGGVFTDLLRDRALRLVPLTDLDAADLVRSVRAAPLLFGYRGTPAVDVPALEELLLRVARLAEELPDVAELDLNPVIARPDGVLAVDAKVRLAPPPPRPDLLLRRLP